jgi:hypothetical protein
LNLIEEGISDFLVELFLVVGCELKVEFRECGYGDEGAFSEEEGVEGGEHEFGEFEFAAFTGVQNVLGEFDQNVAQVLH